MIKNRRVLDVWRHIEPRFGGVGPAAAQLASVVQRSTGWESHLVAVCDVDENLCHGAIPAYVHRVHESHRRPMADIALRRSLDGEVREADICHVHGLWEPHAIAVRSLAKKYGKWLVSSVHGALSPWELHKKSKRLKKAAYSLLFERPSLAQSHCIRALTLHEAEDCRRYGLKNPIAVIPTGITLIQRPRENSFLSRFPHLSGRSIVLYLGRVHYQKGILDLVRAWGKISVQHPEAHLVIVGPDHRPTRKQLDEDLSKRQLTDSVTFTGVLTGDLKIGALAAARFFCLPSYSEGLSVALLEALSIGLPVIITPTCNMDEVESWGAGAVTSADANRLAETISHHLSFSGDRWLAMSAAASRLASERYEWKRVANQMSSVYDWILGGPKPDCVID